MRLSAKNAGAVDDPIPDQTASGSGQAENRMPPSTAEAIAAMYEQALADASENTAMESGEFDGDGLENEDIDAEVFEEDVDADASGDKTVTLSVVDGG